MTQNSDDLRVRRTRKLIREALIALIEERSFDAITVGEIAKRAMVSRAAFYRYYHDKYDLVEQIFEEAMHTLMSEIGPAPRHLLGDLGPQHLPEPWVKLFEHFAGYERLYRALLGGKGSSWFVMKMRTSLAEAVSERAHQFPPPPNGKRLAEAEEFVTALVAALLVDAIAWWLEHGRPYTPRQTAMYCSLLASSILKEVSTWE
jgi:AcrR family transcriptional regulator